MQWKCFTCEHINNSNFTECEVCGTSRNLYAEEVFEYKEVIKKLQLEIKIIKTSFIKLNSEREKLIAQASKNSVLIKNLLDTTTTGNSELQLLKNKEIDLLSIIKQKENKLNEISSKILILNNEISEKVKLIKYRDNRIMAKDSEINNLKESQIAINVSLNSKKKIIWILAVIILLITSIIYYDKVHKMEQNNKFINQTKIKFSNYLDSLPKPKCMKENIATRNVLMNDINNDGESEGIVITTFNGIDCKNKFEQIIFVYNLKNNFLRPFAEYSLSRLNKGYLTNESYYSFRGIENDTLSFDKLNLKNYYFKKYNPDKMKNSYSRIHIYASVKFDTLFYPPF